MITYDELRKAGWGDAAARREARVQELLEAILKEQPGLNIITAHILAGDRWSAEYWYAAQAEGKVSPMQAISLTGSYYRWDQAVRLHREGRIDDALFYGDICERWRGADPDDTSPEALEIWRNAYEYHGGIVRDGRAVPEGARKAENRGVWVRGYEAIVVYRGGLSTDEATGGCAWTTDIGIAEKFARGAGLRVQSLGGVVVQGRVRRSDILAYITGRGESEVICDPADVVVDAYRAVTGSGMEGS